MNYLFFTIHLRSASQKQLLIQQMAAIDISPAEATFDASGGSALFQITNNTEKRIAFKVQLTKFFIFL